jgi:hypothetical protein
MVHKTLPFLVVQIRNSHFFPLHDFPSNMTNYRSSNLIIRTDATSEAETTYPSGVPEFILCLYCGSCCAICVAFCV